MTHENIYAIPSEVNDINQCRFYHTIDIPGYGLVKGDWDLREGIDEYLGYVNFKGKRVLEFGKANGGLSFEMEKRGAEVIGFDLSEDYEWDVVPYAQYNYLQEIKWKKVRIKKLNNGFWFAHRLLESKVKVVYGTLYRIPKEIGMVDIATYGAILLHVRDPFGALQQGLSVVKETVIVTDVLTQPTDQPLMKFLPDSKDLRHKDVWWQLTPEIIVRMIGILGFEDSKVIFHEQLFKGKMRKMYTVVGKRTSGFAK